MNSTVLDPTNFMQNSRGATSGTPRLLRKNKALRTTHHALRTIFHDFTDKYPMLIRITTKIPQAKYPPMTAGNNPQP